MFGLLHDPEFLAAVQDKFAPAAPPAPAPTTFAVHVHLRDGTQVHYLEHGGIAFDHILAAHEKFGELAERLEVAPVPQSRPAQPKEAA